MTLVAFAAGHRAPGLAGFLIAVLSVGGVVGGLHRGARKQPGSNLQQLAVPLLALAVGWAVLALAHSPWLLAGLLALAGLILNPAITARFSTMDDVAPRGAITESFADRAARRLVLVEDDRARRGGSLFAGVDLDVPHYRPAPASRVERVRRMLDALRACDGVVLVSPTYHGTISGVLKNALDYINDLEAAPRPFLDGRPVGRVTVASAHQGACTTLATLRTIVHALRGWPTPLGVAAWGPSATMDNGAPADQQTAGQLRIMLAQVLGMSAQNARRRHRSQDGARRAAEPLHG